MPSKRSRAAAKMRKRIPLIQAHTYPHHIPGSRKDYVQLVTALRQPDGQRVPSNPGFAASTPAHPELRAKAALVRSSNAGLAIIQSIETEASKLAAWPPTSPPTSPSASLFTSPISPTSRSAPIPIPSRSTPSAQVQARQSLESSIMFYNFTCAKHEAASRKNRGLQRTAPLRRVVDRMLPEIFDDARNARLEVEEDARGGLYIVVDDDERALVHGYPAPSGSRGAAHHEPSSTATQRAGDPDRAAKRDDGPKERHDSLGDDAEASRDTSAAAVREAATDADPHAAKRKADNCDGDGDSAIADHSSSDECDAKRHKAGVCSATAEAATGPVWWTGLADRGCDGSPAWDDGECRGWGLAERVVDKVFGSAYSLAQWLGKECKS